MLQSHLHSLIAKAHRYQAEPERFERTSQEPLRVSVHGANGDHEVVLLEGQLGEDDRRDDDRNRQCQGEKERFESAVCSSGPHGYGLLIRRSRASQFASDAVD